MDDPTGLTASELSKRIHERRMTCVSVMEAFLDRIERYNPRLNAIVSLRDRPALIAEARLCDRELDDGRSRGWLHGMPIAIKDLAEAKGLPCTWGSRIFADYVSTADDIHVGRIRAAGAIVIGKTNTPEMGFGSHTTNRVFGLTRNPHAITKTPGGSSGGAAAALAARLLPVADGSDMMGSLRNPAAFNAIVGFRPSPGRVPGNRAGELFFNQFSVSGPMARNVGDVARLLAVQAGRHSDDPFSLADKSLELSQDADLSGSKVAWLGDFGGHLALEEGVLDLDRRALAVMADMGCTVEEVTPDFDMEALWRAWLVLRSFGAANKLRPLHSDPERRALFNPQALWEIERGMALSAADVYAASSVRSDWYRCVCRLFERYDYLVLPAAQVFPFDVETRWPESIAGRAMDTYHRWMEVTIGPTMAGLPVAAMPAGFAANGLPNGVQIVGRPRSDRAVLQFALAYEQAAGIGCPLPADL